MTANLRWSDFWPMYINMIKEQKERTWAENFGQSDGWKEFVESKTGEVQIEILKEAPEEIKVVLADVICKDAKEKLLEFMHPKQKDSNKSSGKWEKYHPK
jgi:hypothetical protein